MTSVSEHYANHLGPVYSWMAGGVEAAINRGADELDDLPISPSDGRVAVDLGAGFGMHAIPLARGGYSVLAVDTCAELLGELDSRKHDMPIQIVEDDLLAFRQHLHKPADRILCMGDTITHLESVEAVGRLIGEVASALHPGGRFIVTFRDYSNELTGDDRFIPVKSDENRILTCFLEYADAHVTVHDLLYERDASNWNLRVSSYRKLRLNPDWLVLQLESHGFSVRQETVLSGMVRLVAQQCDIELPSS